MKINYISIAAGIIAFVSLAFPWWIMPFSGTITVELTEVEMSGDISVYAHDARVTMEAMGLKETQSMVDDFSIWYGYAALALIVIAGLVGIVGSLTVGKNGKMILVVAGILALLSIIIFAAGLDHELVSPREVEPGLPELTNVRASGSFGLFSSGSFSADIPGEGSMEFDYSTYLTVGFWLAVVATILTFVSLLRHPMVAPPPPPPLGAWSIVLGLCSLVIPAILLGIGISLVAGIVLVFSYSFVATVFLWWAYRRKVSAFVGLAVFEFSIASLLVLIIENQLLNIHSPQIGLTLFLIAITIGMFYYALHTHM